MPLSDIVKFVPISDVLATSGQPTEAQLGELAEAGFEVIINLALHDDPRYSLRDEPGAVAALGMAYVHIPVQFASPTREDFQAFFVALLRSVGKKTLVHCAHNKRVAVFLALHRILNEGWEKDRAVAAMQAVWMPDETLGRFFETMLT